MQSQEYRSHSIDVPRRMTSARVVVLLVVSLIGLMLTTLHGCTDWEKFNPTGTLHHHTPRATGIWLTDKSTITGTWGSPVDSIVAYPNPSVPPINITFEVPPNPGRVTLWLVRALGPGESASDLVVWGGADVISSDGAPVKVLVNDDREAGHYVIRWGGDTSEGTAAPNGFYRIWLAVGEKITFTDIFVGDNLHEYPR